MTPEAMALITAFANQSATPEQSRQDAQAAGDMALDADPSGQALYMGLVETVVYLLDRCANLQGTTRGQVLAELALVAAMQPPMSTD